MDFSGHSFRIEDLHIFSKILTYADPNWIST